jgi:hypothetical protein
MPPKKKTPPKDYVVVRSSQSGVWLGALVSSEPDGPGTVRVKLTDARKAWQWSGAAATSGLAARGPSGGRIADPVTVVVGGCCEVIDATPEAVARWRAVAPWRP